MSKFYNLFKVLDYYYYGFSNLDNYILETLSFKKLLKFVFT